MKWKSNIFQKLLKRIPRIAKHNTVGHIHNKYIGGNEKQVIAD